MKFTMSGGDIVTYNKKKPFITKSFQYKNTGIVNIYEQQCPVV